MARLLDLAFNSGPAARGRLAACAFIFGVASAGSAFATDGYFADGYGVQSKGLAGAGLAYPKDSLALATNPAAAFVLGNRFDVDADYFAPKRTASYSGTALNASYSGDASPFSIIPEFGVTHRLGDRVAVGVAVYGNGGMVTRYADNPFARFGATGKAGVDLEQLFVSPTVAYQLAPGHVIGLSVNISEQLFHASGIGPFSLASAAPKAFTEQGIDSAAGVGARIGYLGQITPRISVGAYYQTRTDSQKFSKYAGLFANQGQFDIPSAYGVGVAVKATDALDLVADIHRINYSEVASVGDSIALLFANHPFGSSGGPGFGWRDVTTYKIGANYRITPSWQVRAGWAYNTQPIPSSQTFLNILAPAVVQQQYTAGVTWTGKSGLEISGYVLEAPKTTVNGQNSIPSSFGGGEANISLAETAVGVGFGWKY